MVGKNNHSQIQFKQRCITIKTLPNIAKRCKKSSLRFCKYEM